VPIQKNNVLQFPTKEEREERKEPMWGTSAIEQVELLAKNKQLNDWFKIFVDRLPTYRHITEIEPN